MFYNTDLKRIPYNTLVEVPFVVPRNYYGPNSLCDEFNDIKIQIIATCEQPSPSSAVYQYGVRYNESTKQTDILYDAADRIYAANSTAAFSVKWPSSRRRLSNSGSPGLSNADGSDTADALAAILLRKIEDHKESIMQDMMARETRLMIYMGCGLALMMVVSILLRGKTL